MSPFLYTGGGRMTPCKHEKALRIAEGEDYFFCLECQEYLEEKFEEWDSDGKGKGFAIYCWGMGVFFLIIGMVLKNMVVNLFSIILIFSAVIAVRFYNEKTLFSSRGYFPLKKKQVNKK